MIEQVLSATTTATTQTTCSVWARATTTNTTDGCPVPGQHIDNVADKAHTPGDNDNTPQHAVAVLSLCDGIGAVTQALRQLNVNTKAFTSEIIPEALLITDTRQPHDTKLGDHTTNHRRAAGPRGRQRKNVRAHIFRSWHTMPGQRRAQRCAKSALQTPP